MLITGKLLAAAAALATLTIGSVAVAPPSLPISPTAPALVAKGNGSSETQALKPDSAADHAAGASTCNSGCDIGSVFARHP